MSSSIVPASSIHSLQQYVRDAFVRPFLIALRRLFKVREHVRFVKLLSKLRHDRFELFPHAEKLAARFKEEILVEQVRN